MHAVLLTNSALSTCGKIMDDVNDHASILVYMHICGSRYERKLILLHGTARTARISSLLCICSNPPLFTPSQILTPIAKHGNRAIRSHG